MLHATFVGGFDDVQPLELHQHFVAVVVGHKVTEGFHVALQGGVEPVAHGALDIDFVCGRLAALGGHTVARLAIAYSVLAENTVYRHLETDGLQVAVAFYVR